MAVQFLDPRVYGRTGGQEFVEGASPYLQQAFEYLMKKKLLEPEEKRKLSEEQRAIEKEKREAISGVSKGEIPITAIPESIRQSIIKGRSIDTTGLTGSPENLQALQNISPTAQISGIPSFMQRVKPAETPEQAQTRLMGAYAQQQQAINPYRALQSDQLTLRMKIANDLQTGIRTWEQIPIWEKVMAGLVAKPGGTTDILSKIINLLDETELGETSPTPTPTPQPKVELIEVTNLQGKRVKIKSSDLENALKQGYKR